MKQQHFLTHFTDANLNTNSAFCPICASPFSKDDVGKPAILLVRNCGADQHGSRFIHPHCARTFVTDPKSRRNTALLQVRGRQRRGGESCAVCGDRAYSPFVQVLLHPQRPIRFTLCLECLGNLGEPDGASLREKAQVRKKGWACRLPVRRINTVENVLTHQSTVFELSRQGIQVECPIMSHESFIHWRELRMRAPVEHLGQDAIVPDINKIKADLAKSIAVHLRCEPRNSRKRASVSSRRSYASLHCSTPSDVSRYDNQFWQYLQQLEMGPRTILEIYSKVQLVVDARRDGPRIEGRFRLDRVMSAPEKELPVFLSSPCVYTRRAAVFRLKLIQLAAASDPQDSLEALHHSGKTKAETAAEVAT